MFEIFIGDHSRRLLRPVCLLLNLDPFGSMLVLYSSADVGAAKNQCCATPLRVLGCRGAT